MKRFDSVSTMNESQNLFKTIKSELDTVKPVTETMVNKITSTPSTSSSEVLSLDDCFCLLLQNSPNLSKVYYLWAWFGSTRKQVVKIIGEGLTTNNLLKTDFGSIWMGFYNYSPFFPSK